MARAHAKTTGKNAKKVHAKDLQAKDGARVQGGVNKQELISVISGKVGLPR